MSQDFGILISQPGADATVAKKSQITLNTSNPFIKIDTQNKKGFQTITLIITTDPPEPTGAGNKWTTLYQFPHGYSYVPSLESLFYVSTPPPVPYNAATQTYFQNGGLVGGASIDGEASLYAIADATNVYIICVKASFDGTSHTLLTGTNVQITLHVFVEDIGV